MKNISISNVYAEIPATKPDAGYEYEGPVEDLPRNVSPAIIITGLPNKKITGVTVNNIQIIHPGGGNLHYANVPLNALDSIPEIPANYPDFSMFKEIPAWAIYIRHAVDVKFSNINLKAEKKDYRVPVVLDDVQNATFTSFSVKQPNVKDVFYVHKSTGITIDKGVKISSAK
jgi:hypothetical protein